MAAATSHVTMRDIADEVGVSVAAVSYALNGREGMVGEATRDRILDSARRLDYQPNQLMKAVRTQRTDVVGVLVPSFRTTFFAGIVGGIEKALAAQGYHAVMCQTRSTPAIAAENVAVLRQRRVDGIIATPGLSQKHVYEPLVAAGLPVVFVDAEVPGLPIPCVRSDDRLGACLAVRHLLAQGHRRIATMRTTDRYLVGGMLGRFEGYRDALAGAGIPVDDELVLTVARSEHDAEWRELARELLVRTDATAVFLPTDMMALALMRVAHGLGRRVPESLAVAGYSNQEAGEYTIPTLTTVDQKPAEIGRVAVERLLALIAGQPCPPPFTYLVGPELVVRESSQRVCV